MARSVRTLYPFSHRFPFQHPFPAVYCGAGFEGSKDVVDDAAFRDQKATVGLVDRIKVVVEVIAGKSATGLGPGQHLIGYLVGLAGLDGPPEVWPFLVPGANRTGGYQELFPGGVFQLTP